MSTEAIPAREETATLIPAGEFASGQPDDKFRWLGNAVATGVLGIVSYAAFWAENKGLTKQLPLALELPANSMAHPVLGYAAGFAVAAAEKVSGKEVLKKMSGRLALLSTAVLDTAAEFYQYARTNFTYNPLSVSPPHYAYAETAKDAGFALLGLGLFYLVNRGKAKAD